MWEDRRLRDITEGDLRQIVDSGLVEHLQLEYKSALYADNERGHHASSSLLLTDSKAITTQAATARTSASSD